MKHAFHALIGIVAFSVMVSAAVAVHAEDELTPQVGGQALKLKPKPAIKPTANTKITGPVPTKPGAIAPVTKMQTNAIGGGANASSPAKGGANASASAKSDANTGSQAKSSSDKADKSDNNRGGLNLPPGFKGGNDKAGDKAKGDKPEKKGPPQMGNATNERQETQEFKAGVKYYFDFYDAELVDFVTQMSEKFKVNFILSDKVKGSKVTVISPNPITREEAWQAFISVLNSKDLALVRVGKFYKIVPAKDAQKEPLKTYLEGGTTDPSEELITYLLKLKYLAISDVDKILKDLKSNNGQVITFEPTNTLIITDTAISIRRMVKILNELDLPSGRDSIHVIDIYYAGAADVAEKLQQIFGDKGAGKGAAKGKGAGNNNAPKKGDGKDDSGQVTLTNVIADERTNQLIIVAPRDAMPRILDMINRLDVPIPGDGQVHVYYLENANAEELATTLTSTTSGAAAKGGAKGAKGAGAAKAGGALFEGDVKITADKSTNSLVIIASTKDFNMLKRVIKELDIRRRQVFVEAVIMEVSLSKSNQLGLAANGGHSFTIDGQKVPIFAATTLGTLSSLSIDATTLSGMAVGLRGPDLAGTENLLGTGVALPAFGVVLQMLQTDSDANVLSTPHILTMDNEEAEIIVGSNVPFITGQARDSNNRPVLSIQRQDVALTMKIKPQINESDYVRLNVQQEVSEIQSISETLGPTTTKRSAKSTVVVKDNQTIVIGGLLRNVDKKSVDKVPFFGDIPLLGRLFRRDSDSSDKTNLLIFLTPHIIKDEDDFKRIFKRKMDERNEFLRKFYGNAGDYDFATDYAQKTGALESVRATYETEKTTEEMRRKEEQELVIGPHDGHVAHEVGLVEKPAAPKLPGDKEKDKDTTDKPDAKSEPMPDISFDKPSAPDKVPAAAPVIRNSEAALGEQTRSVDALSVPAAPPTQTPEAAPVKKSNTESTRDLMNQMLMRDAKASDGNGDTP